MSLSAKAAGAVVRLLVVVLLFALPSAALAAGYIITAPLKGKCRPDLPSCTPFYQWMTPVIAGDYVVFTTRNGPPDAVWSYRISTKKLRKLAGIGTKVPGGKGNFTAISDLGSDYQTTIGGTVAAFFGRDENNTLGLYTVSVQGGEITRIVTTKTNVPGTTEKFTNLSRASTNGETIAFWGMRASNISGIYKASVDGTNRKRVIDSTQPLDARGASGPQPDYFNIFSRPTIGKTYVQFQAGGLFDPSTGANAIFRARNGSFIDIADNRTLLLGGTPGQHVRIGADSAAVGGNAIAFSADEPNTGFSGVFIARTEGDYGEPFVTTKDNAPNGRKFVQFMGFGYDKTGLVVTAVYKIAGGGTNQGIFCVSVAGNPPVQVAVNGDKYYLPEVGDRSTTDRGYVVFKDGGNFAETFYLAKPNP